MRSYSCKKQSILSVKSDLTKCSYFFQKGEAIYSHGVRPSYPPEKKKSLIVPE